MKVIVNGQEHDLPDGATVRALIERLGLANAACAAEVNKRLVPRRAQETTPLREGDRVEVVSLVGGG
jgi:sulfur carrier protein